MAKDNEVLKFVIRYKAQNNGNSPSYDQIMRACGIKSKSHAKYLLDKLEGNGLLEHDGTRSITIPHTKWIQEA